MKKFLLLGMVLALCVVHVSAGSISRVQALERARQFLMEQGMDSQLKDAESQTASARRMEKGELPCYYVFNVGSREGFVIMAGDDMAPSVLGYSDHGEIDMDHLPVNMQAWLEGCEQQIKYLRSSGISFMTPLATKAEVKPFLKTEWNQYAPYNLLVPANCATGCVATAMAQVMYYYKYPNATKAAIPAYTYKQSSTGQTKSISGVSAGSSINWNNMLTKYTGTESASAKEAVARLMEYCGKSVEMWYDTSSSAVVKDIAGAMKKYFGYSNNVTYKNYNDDRYSTSQWDNMIYYELMSGRPVILSGHVSSSKSSAGHAFVCDGYDGKGRYHINWGWGGDGDGFYALDMLLPTTTGYNWGKLSYHWEAIIGIETGGSSQSETTAWLTVTDFTLSTSQRDFQGTDVNGVKSYGPLGFTMGFANNMKGAHGFEVNIGVYQGGVFKEYLFDEVQVSRLNTIAEIPSGATGWWNSDKAIYLPGGSTLKCFSQPGIYKLVPVSRKSGTTSWTLCPGADEHFITGEVSDSGLKLTVTGEVNPVNPTGNVTADELRELANRLTNQREEAELRMADVRDLRDSLAAYESRISEIKYAYQELCEQFLELKRQALFYDQSPIATAVESTLTLLRSVIDKDIDAVEKMRNEDATACDIFWSDLVLLEYDMTKQARDLNTIVTREEYETLLTSIALNATKIPTPETIMKIRDADLLSMRTKLNATYSSLFGSRGAKLAYNTYNDMLLKAIENKDELKERQRIVQETEEKLNALKTDFTNLEEKLRAAAYNEQVFLQNIQIHEYNLELLRARMEDLDKRLTETDMKDEQRQQLQQEYGQLKERYERLKADVAQAKTLAETVSVTEEQIESVRQALNQLTTDYNQAESIDDYQAVWRGTDEWAERLVALQEIGVGKYEKLMELMDVADTWNAEVKDIENAAGILLAGITAAGEETRQELLRMKEDLQKEVEELDEQFKNVMMGLSAWEDRRQNYLAIVARLKLNNEAFLMAKATIQEKLESKNLTAEEAQAFADREAKLVETASHLLEDAIYNVQANDFEGIQNDIFQKLSALSQHVAAIENADGVADVRKEADNLRTLLNALAAENENGMVQIGTLISKAQTAVEQMVQLLEQQQQLESEISVVITGIGAMMVDGKRVVGCYDAKGRPASPRQKGLVVLRFSDGSIKKVYNK